MESVSIGADKGWDLSKLVQLEVLGGDTLRRLSLNNLEVDIVGLGHSANGSRAGVTRVGVELSERHDCGDVFVCGLEVGEEGTLILISIEILCWSELLSKLNIAITCKITCHVFQDRVLSTVQQAILGIATSNNEGGMPSRWSP